MVKEALLKMLKSALTDFKGKCWLSYYNRFMSPAVGGMTRSQSNRNEDAYFNEQSINQFRKINKEGCTVKNPVDYKEYERVLNSGNICPESTYRNKHKVMQEETFFLTEQNECKKSMTVKKLQKLMKSRPVEDDDDASIAEDASTAEVDSNEKP